MAPQTSKAKSVTDDSGLLSRLFERKWVVITLPSLWIALFIIAPILLVLKISFSESQVSIPPYTNIFSFMDEGILTIKLNLKNFIDIFNNPFYVSSFLRSLKIASISTAFCLFIGYPMAYYISNQPESKRNVYLFFIILPFWTSFLVRVYAWVGLLKGSGIINSTLMTLGLIDQPLEIMNTDIAVCIAIVYSYLPFMVLPLYATLQKLDKTVLEAAYDLGCHPIKAFMKITIPLSLSGIVSGCLIVFIPAIGEVVIPLILGGIDNSMIGKVLWNEFFINGNWPMASAIAVVMLGVLLIPIILLQKLNVQTSQSRQES